jgi:hypothetical protein
MTTATAAEPTASSARRADTAAGTATYLVAIEVVSNGKRRHVALVCDAESRDAAAQVAQDVNEEERHVYIKSLHQISELQIIHPLAWDERTGLTRESA